MTATNRLIEEIQETNNLRGKPETLPPRQKPPRAQDIQCNVAKCPPQVHCQPMATHHVEEVHSNQDELVARLKEKKRRYKLKIKEQNAKLQQFTRQPVVQPPPQQTVVVQERVTIPKMHVCPPVKCNCPPPSAGVKEAVEGYKAKLNKHHAKIKQLKTQLESAK